VAAVPRQGLEDLARCFRCDDDDSAGTEVRGGGGDSGAQGLLREHVDDRVVEQDRVERPSQARFLMSPGTCSHSGLRERLTSSISSALEALLEVRGVCTATGPELEQCRRSALDDGFDEALDEARLLGVVLGA